MNKISEIENREKTKQYQKKHRIDKFMYWVNRFPFCGKCYFCGVSVDPYSEKYKPEFHHMIQENKTMNIYRMIFLGFSEEQIWLEIMKGNVVLICKSCHIRETTDQQIKFLKYDTVQYISYLYCLGYGVKSISEISGISKTVIYKYVKAMFKYSFLGRHTGNNGLCLPKIENDWNLAFEESEKRNGELLKYVI